MRTDQWTRTLFGELGTFVVIPGVVTASLLVAAWGRSGFDNPCDAGKTNCVILASKDFTPQDGTYDINWPGPPRHRLSFSDVEQFTANLQLDRNAPTTFSREFLIKKDKWLGSDTLGQFTATFAAGSRTPTISYPAQCCGATATPAGTPDPQTGNTFWMGCTEKGYVKANGAHTDDRQATVYLEKVNKSDSIGVQGKFSPKHSIYCR